MRPIALLFALSVVAACTTSFDLSELPSRLDATVAADARPDVSSDASVDAPVGCGTLNGSCCTGDAASSGCNVGLVCTSGVCLQCPGALFACDGVCVDTQSSPVHCGNCGRQCPEGQSCNRGTCQVVCAQGLTLCGGRCVQTLTSLAHCAMCNNPCAYAHASATCAGGVCTKGPCEAGWGDCDGDAANGCETPLDTTARCGACGTTCAPRNATATCTDGRCGFAACAAGFANCDGDTSNGCEVDTRNNGAHCGGCAMACTAGTNCVGGACVVGMTCGAGLGDCDRVSTNGCEATLNTDASNCGACGNACALPNATSVCAMGTCAVGSCNAGFGDCDPMAAGCETNTRTSLAHCGACDRACAPAHASAACVDGACRIAMCDAGWGDCNGDASDGCEVDLNASAMHCGGCGMACAVAGASAACVMGVCAVGTCNPGFADCNGSMADGCEVDTRTSAGNCGACRAVCALPHAVTACREGACALTGCESGFADCDGMSANGCEVDTRSDPSHCGTCTTACSVRNGTAACVAGACAVGACSAGFADCNMMAADGCEVDITSDGRNCGGCGVACATGQVCSAGVCRASCASGQTLCGGACVDLQTSLTNCGGCGVACPTRDNATLSCSAGRCRYACQSGYGDCDGNATNGCEARLASDVRNCARCGNACPSGANATASCSNSVCTFSCASGFADCDANRNNGCEQNISNNAEHCGSCTRVCSAYPNAAPTCRSGTCVVGTCNAGYANCDGMNWNGCEANLATAVLNCGSCGHACPALMGETCVGGSCVCVAGLTRCSGRCVNLNNDQRNCGSCGRACGSLQRCVNGACVP